MAGRRGREGQQLGSYRLIRLLGEGGFAEVYLGQHIYLDTLAAIKVLHTQLDGDEVEHFHSEARIIARLMHPSIVRVLDYGIEDKTPFLVVDYAPNGTLRKRHVKGVPLPLTTVVNYVAQIADALQYAHEQQVIHRDVKPENMLVAQGSHYHSTQSMQDLAGTIAYMAPEQIQSQAVPNSDQYALGIVVYEWLSGARPFLGSFAEIAVKHTIAVPPALHEKIPTLSPTVEEIVMKALAKDPKQRFVDVQAFATALKQAYQNEPASLTTLLEDKYPASSSLTYSPAETVVLSDEEASPAALFKAPGVLPPLSSTASLSSETPPPSPVETTALEPLPATPLPSQSPRRGVSRRSVLLGLAGVAAASAVGGGIAWLTRTSGSQGREAAPPLHSRPKGEGALLYTFNGHTNWVWSAAWSPDGSRIVSASSEGTVQVWDAADGNHLYIYYGHSDFVYAVAWSPDGKRIASAGDDKTVQVWDAAYGAHPYTYAGHSGSVRTVAWSPDGKRITSGSWDKTVQVWLAG